MISRWPRRRRRRRRGGSETPERPDPTSETPEDGRLPGDVPAGPASEIPETEDPNVEARPHHGTSGTEAR